MIKGRRINKKRLLMLIGTVVFFTAGLIYSVHLLFAAKPFDEPAVFELGTQITDDPSNFIKTGFIADKIISPDITAVDAQSPGEYPVEIYDSKGNLVDTATVVNGTATFKLRHNEYALIKNVPIGVKWEVEEEKYTGYSTSAETPNKGTIGLMVSVSKWKNHRSTVPPVPRTGYGDGTTVKVGLGASLGVFLASAIGSIFQSRSTKKKKRGGGSHAAN